MTDIFALADSLGFQDLGHPGPSEPPVTPPRVAADSEGRAGHRPVPGAVPFTLPQQPGPPRFDGTFPKPPNPPPPPPQPFPPNPFPRPGEMEIGRRLPGDTAMFVGPKP
jgi:hypothetical protein